MTNEQKTFALTKELVLSVAAGIGALRQNASEIERQPEFKEDNGTGRILRECAERNKQHADLLAGWVKRNMRAVGLSEEDGLYV